MRNSCTRNYLHPCFCGLLVVLSLGISALPCFAQAPVWSRGEQLLPISYDECMQRAESALASEGFGIVHRGGAFVVGQKGIHTAVIMCNVAPERKTWANIVVASSANNGDVPGEERVKLQGRMDRAVGRNPNLSGNWYRTNDPCKRTLITQSGNTLTFTNEFGNSSKGSFLDATTVVATDWEGGLRGRISSDGSRIDWANGASWSMNVGAPKTIPPLMGAWCRTGDPKKRTSITQSGGNTLTVTNEFGNSSQGRFWDATTVVATDWESGLCGRISSDGSRIDWANGTSWSKLE